MISFASKMLISKSAFTKTVSVVASRNATHFVPMSTRNFSNLNEESEKKTVTRPFLSKGLLSEVTIHPPSNLQIISSDFGLQSFLRKTYLFTGASIAASIGIAGVTATYLPTIGFNAIAASMVGIVGGVLGISFGDYKLKEDVYITRTSKRITIYSSDNSIFRLTSFGALVSSFGILMAPAFANYPEAIAPTLIASLTVFSSSVLYTYSRPADSASVLGPSLTTGLTSLLFVGFGGVLCNNLLGPTASLSLALHNADIFLGIPLFAGFVAYDTQKAIKMYEVGNADHLSCTVDLYLDFVNIFLRLLEIMGKSNESS